MNKREKILRQFLRSTCDVNSTIEPDLKLVCQNGKFTFAHKFVLLAFLPDLQNLFCKFCLEGHDTTTIIIPSVTVEDVIQARDFLYMFGENESFAKLFDMKKDPSINSESKRESSSVRNKSKVAPEPKRIIKPNRKKISLKKKEPKEKVSLEKAMNLFETRNLKSCSITSINMKDMKDVSGSKNGAEISGSDEMRDSLTDYMELKSEPVDEPMDSREQKDDGESERLNIILADDQELIGEELLKTEDISIIEGVLSHEEFPYEIQKVDFSEPVKNKNRTVVRTQQTKRSSTKKTKPVVDEKLNCKACGKSYNQASLLKIHFDMEHLGIRYPCDYCEYLGSQIKTIKTHMESYHPGASNRYKDIKA